ncbi:Crp/Fnr family transcriptional regulator [Reichenbachiella ulvae]|uniref:Crp/Fnr family transcriptional regulator n=1 Tax=Reichenbachiella ulvae TaxID=2980104 RepID=A0ABT3CR26_9BACT|nr:Crp/Fnr family transcriptional regulator [Reichenbachiella ulvae]MCV9386018.1 Crp/Fnr family transcriptional regulator [Reichenbachiella ulvae]
MQTNRTESFSTADRHEFLNRFHPISQEEFNAIQEKIKSKTLKRNESLIRPGQVQKQLFLIRSGVQMCHYDQHDKKHVIAFTYPPNLCAIPDSFSEQVPSRYGFTSVTASEVDCLSFEDLQLLYAQFPNIETLFRRINEKLLVRLLNLHIEFRSMSIEERFTAFCQRSPHLLQKVPHKYIASYLGIDATNFSKLFNSIRI